MRQAYWAYMKTIIGFERKRLRYWISNLFQYSPKNRPSPHPTMPDICISKEGIEKMLQNIKPDKAAGPDSLPATVLKELSHEIAPILKLIYCRSIQSGIVPSDWKTGNITSISKKGDKRKASNYRPVSLTCILGKCMEHIIVSSLSTHLASSHCHVICGLDLRSAWIQTGLVKMPVCTQIKF